MGKILDDFLRSRNKTAESVGTSLYEKLLIVENEIIKRNNSIAKANETLKMNAINITSISESTGISRKTFYNQTLLSEFVKQNSSTDHTLKKECEKLKDKHDELKEKFLKEVTKDVDDLILKNEICELQRELQNARNRVQVLEEQHEEDMRKLNLHVNEKQKYQA